MAESIRVEEARASIDKPFLLTRQFQAFLSSEVQLIAIRLAQLADNATVRQVIVHPNPADEDMGWDRLVDETRDTLRDDFLSRVYGMVSKGHPVLHQVTLEARTKLFLKSELALKIALSKHQAVRAASTILGRRQLDACAACNRYVGFRQIRVVLQIETCCALAS